MAGVKITDLTPLGTSASDDLLYIVDVSDFTESPQGTSKQIEVGKMFSSGTYTPTISGETNITAIPNGATYIRVGNIVNVSMLLYIGLAAGETSGGFEISLPIATDFTSQKDGFGVLQYSYSGNMAEIVGLSIGADITNNTCLIGIETANAEAQLQYCALIFQYQII
jgi:hypothetical protein